MAWKKWYKKKRYRKPYAKKRVDKWQNKQITYLKKNLRSETNFVISRATAALTFQNFVTAVGAPISLNDIAQGTGFGDRLGSFVKPIRLRGQVFLAGTQATNVPGTDQNIPVRVIVVQDYGYTAATGVLTGGQLLNDYVTTNGSYANYFSTFNENYVRVKGKPFTRGNRAAILYDGKTMLQPVYSGYAAQNGCYKTCNINVKPGTINYVGTAATAYGAGTVYMYVIPGKSTTAADNAGYVYYFEMEFEF